MTTESGRRRAGWPVVLSHLLSDGSELVLRPPRPRDRVEWSRVRTANRSWLGPWEATLPPGAPPGPRSYAALARTLNTQARAGHTLSWLIWLRTDRVSTLIGQITVSGIVAGSAGWGQIGYWIDASVAGRGLMPTAVAMVVDHCFHDRAMHRIEVAIRPENAASLRVVHKLGFRPEGLRPRYLHIDGDWRDHLVFALNSEEVPEHLLRRWLSQLGRDTPPQVSAGGGDLS